MFGFSFLIFIGSLELSRGDMCHDFCLRELGAAACTRGSYCKNRHDCHGLFWTGSVNPRICVFTGNVAACSNSNPVLCEEATIALAATTSSPVVATPRPVTTTTATTARATTVVTTTTTARPTTTTVRVRMEQGDFFDGDEEAFRALLSALAPTTTTTTPPPPMTTTTMTTTPPSTTTVRPRGDYFDGSDEELFAILEALYPTTTTTTAAPTTTTTFRPTGTVAQVGRARITMHYNREVEDNRPRVDIRFLGHDMPVTYSLMFDTGSSVTHIRVEAGATTTDAPWTESPTSEPESLSDTILRPAREGEGYVDVGAGEVVGGGRDLYYGDDASLRAVPVQRRIREMAQIYCATDRFAHELFVDLTSAIDNRYTGVGLLGAGRRSEFAEAVGVFAYLPPAARYVFGAAAGDAGRLIIGERDFAALEAENCQVGTRLQFRPLQLGVSQNHWVIAGSLWSGNVAAPPENLNWVVDTGAGGWYVTQGLFDQVIGAIRASGGIPNPYAAGYFTRVEMCSSTHLLPTIAFSLNPDWRAGPVIRIPPNEYMQVVAGNRCYLKLQPSGMTSLGGARLLGMGVLSKLFTVFDRENDRLGFCIKK